MLASSMAHASPLEHHAAAMDLDSLWIDFETHFVHPPEWDVAEEGTVCLTGLVARLRQNLDGFSPERQEQILNAIEPWRQKERSEVEDAPPPPGAAPCIGHYGDNYIVGDHFSVEWDDGTSVSESSMNNFLEALEYSWDVEVDELGWAAPSGASYYPLLVYIQSGNYAGGYTTITECSTGGYGYMPYIVAYAGSFSTGQWYKTLAAHEFNHATQFYYGYRNEFYWWEATATWLEEYVYPAQNDWASSIYYGYSEQPHLAMNASDQQNQDIFWHMYAMSVFAQFLDQHIDGHDMVQGTWEYAAANNSSWGYYDLWMPDIIEGMGYDFAEVYTHFMAVASVMDFNESAYYYQPALADTVSSLPADGEAPSQTQPQSLGQNFIKFKAGSGEEGMALEVTFDGEDGAEWFAVLARGEENALSDFIALELDDSGAGVGQIIFDGDEDIYLIVSPMDDSAYGAHYNWSNASEWDYTWSADLVDPATVDDTGSGGGGEGDDDDDDDSKCGCTAGGSAVGLAWLVALTALSRRRRH